MRKKFVRVLAGALAVLITLNLAMHPISATEVNPEGNKIYVYELFGYSSAEEFVDRFPNTEVIANDLVDPISFSDNLSIEVSRGDFCCRPDYKTDIHYLLLHSDVNYGRTCTVTEYRSEVCVYCGAVWNSESWRYTHTHGIN